MSGGCVKLNDFTNLESMVHMVGNETFDFHTSDNEFQTKLATGEREVQEREAARIARITANPGNEDFNRMEWVFQNPPKDQIQGRFGDKGTVLAEKTPVLKFRDSDYRYDSPAVDQDVYKTNLAAGLRGNHNHFTEYQLKGLWDKKEVAGGISDKGIMEHEPNLAPGPFHPFYADDRDWKLAYTKPSLYNGTAPSNVRLRGPEEAHIVRETGGRPLKDDFEMTQQGIRAKQIAPPLYEASIRDSRFMDVGDNRRIPTQVRDQKINLVDRTAAKQTPVNIFQNRIGENPKRVTFDLSKVKEDVELARADGGEKLHVSGAGPIYSVFPNAFSGQDESILSDLTEMDHDVTVLPPPGNRFPQVKRDLSKRPGLFFVY